MYLLSHMWHTGTHIFISHKGNIYEKLTEFTDLDYEFGVQLRDTNNYYESNKFEVITEVIMDSDWLRTTVDDGPVQQVTQPCNDWKNSPAGITQLSNMSVQWWAPRSIFTRQHFYFAIHNTRLLFLELAHHLLRSRLTTLQGYTVKLQCKNYIEHW